MRLSFAVLLLLVADGCGVTLALGPPPATAHGDLSVPESDGEHCVRRGADRDARFRHPLPGRVTDPELASYLQRFEPDVRRSLVAAGLEPLIARLLRAQAEGDRESADVLSLRVELVERLNSLDAQLSGMESESDCVRIAIDDVVDTYDEGERSRQLAYTIGSLVAGAAFGLASAIWDIANSHTAMPAVEDAPLVLALAGAAATVALGAPALVAQPRPIVFVHPHNLLAPIALGADPDHTYPTFVFQMLVLPRAGDEPSPRDSLRARWRERVSAATSDAERALAESILYGVGGTHDPRLLTLHRDLLRLLHDELHAIARDIDRLDRALAVAVDEPRDAPSPTPSE